MKNSNRTFTAEEIQERLRNNPSLAALNPGFSRTSGILIATPKSPASALVAHSEGQDSGKAIRRGKRRKEMNRTEREFTHLLDTQDKTGQIESWHYEGMTLRWGELDNIQYTPDFMVFVKTIRRQFSDLHEIRFIEVKGAHIWPKDIQKFKAARNQWPMFEFQMWQKKNREWTQIL